MLVRPDSYTAMTHFTYQEQQKAENLHQGDILNRTDALSAVLQDVHPYFVDESRCPMFMVLTQTCDLERRNNRECKSHYINICVVRDFTEAVQREFSKLGHPILGKHGLLPLGRMARARQIVESFFNNTQTGYFYLHPEGEAILKPMCAFLTLSIALRAEEHYDVCLAAKAIELKPEFQAKVGWLIGEIYARVATEDWQSQPNFDKDDYNNRIDYIVKNGFSWLGPAVQNKVLQAVKDSRINLSDHDEVIQFVDELSIQYDIAVLIKQQIMREQGKPVDERMADALTKRLLDMKSYKDLLSSIDSSAEGITL
ncbi:MAG: hypothetical protein ACYC7E_18910 [Armatimonadota bacterium]